MARFKSRFSSPPDGVYEYELDGERVQSRSRAEIRQKVKALRASKGLETIGDGLNYVMAWMCPRLPDGFCTEPSTVKYLSATTVREKTQQVFPLALVPSDEAERRMEYCVNECELHSRKGFCLDCTGLVNWVLSGFKGRRGALPADRATGVCPIDETLVMASASVNAEAPSDAQYPEGCWRRKLQKREGDNETRES